MQPKVDEYFIMTWLAVDTLQYIKTMLAKRVGHFICTRLAGCADMS